MDSFITCELDAVVHILQMRSLRHGKRHKAVIVSCEPEFHPSCLAPEELLVGRMWDCLLVGHGMVVCTVLAFIAFLCKTETRTGLLGQREKEEKMVKDRCVFFVFLKTCIPLYIYHV